MKIVDSFKTSSTYLILFLFFFIFYLRENLVDDAIRDMNMSASYSIFLYLAGVFFTVFLYYSRRKKYNKFKIDSFLSNYSYLFLTIELITLLWGTMDSNSENAITVYFTLFYPILVVYISYYAIIETQDNTLFSYLLFLGFLVLCITYFQYAQMRVLLAAQGSEYLASSYYMLYLIPIILSCDKKILTVSSLVITFIILVTSTKRGGTVAFVLAFLAYLIVKYMLVNKNKAILRNLIVLIIILYGSIYIAMDYMSNNDFLIIDRFQRLTTGAQDESRYQIWEKTIAMIKNSDLFEFIFGHGYNTVIRDNPMGFSAHNDFLEIMYDFGFIVFVFYVVLHLKLYRKCVSLIKLKSSFAAPFAFSVILFAINSMVSHIIIYPYNAMTFALVWGVLIGMDYKERLKLNNSKI